MDNQEIQSEINEMQKRLKILVENIKDFLADDYIRDAIKSLQRAEIRLEFAESE